MGSSFAGRSGLPELAEQPHPVPADDLGDALVGVPAIRQTVRDEFHPPRGVQVLHGEEDVRIFVGRGHSAFDASRDELPVPRPVLI